MVTLGFALSLGAIRLAPPDRLERAGAVQNGWRFNTALGFVAIGALPGEASATLAIVVGVGIPLANLYAVTLLAGARQESDRDGDASALDRWRVALREIALNPFLLASLAGVAVGLAGIALPTAAAAFVERLADAALPIVLLSLGAALRGTPAWPPARLRPRPPRRPAARAAGGGLERGHARRRERHAAGDAAGVRRPADGDPPPTCWRPATAPTGGGWRCWSCSPRFSDW